MITSCGWSRGRRTGTAVGVLVALALGGLPAAGCGRAEAPAPSGQVAPAPAADPALQARIGDAVRAGMANGHLRAVIVKVTKGDQVLTRHAFGPSMGGVPATPDMHFRNGAIAFAYLATLLMQFVDERRVTLDDTVDHWMPDLPEAHTVTLKMLANQTTGYPDFETDPAWLAAFNADPFHLWTFEERLRYAFGRPMQFPPGTNWSYAHTNFMILGELLARIGGKPLDVLVREKVLDPMGLRNTAATQTSEIPGPVLHTYSGERRPALGVPASNTTFSEEATYWNTQWGTPIGANQTTTIDDLVTTAVAVGTGSLLSKPSYQAMTASNLLGFGHKEPACEPSCFTQIPLYNFGLGVIRSGSWIMQNPQLSGFSATEAYLPSEKVAIAVAVTYLPQAFDAQGNFPNASDSLFRAIGAVVAPTDPPPALPPS
jgi:CubicO group peptidase (beta-lactamase class C family)